MNLILLVLEMKILQGLASGGSCNGATGLWEEVGGAASDGEDKGEVCRKNL